MDEVLSQQGNDESYMANTSANAQPEDDSCQQALIDQFIANCNEFVNVVQAMDAAIKDFRDECARQK